MKTIKFKHKYNDPMSFTVDCDDEIYNELLKYIPQGWSSLDYPYIFYFKYNQTIHGIKIIRTYNTLYSPIFSFIYKAGSKALHIPHITINKNNLIIQQENGTMFNFPYSAMTSVQF